MPANPIPQQQQPKPISLEDKAMQVKAFGDQIVAKHELSVPPDIRKVQTNAQVRKRLDETRDDLVKTLNEVETAWKIISQMYQQMQMAAQQIAELHEKAKGVVPATMADLNTLLRSRH